MTESTEIQEIVIITGASSGIGAATARELARKGFHVLAGVRRDRDAEAMRGAGIEPLILDITKPDHIRALATRVNVRVLPQMSTAVWSCVDATHPRFYALRPCSNSPIKAARASGCSFVVRCPPGNRTIESPSLPSRSSDSSICRCSNGSSSLPPTRKRN